MNNSKYYYDNRIEFNQYKICETGRVSEYGTCLGLSIDWLHYTYNHEDCSYLKDKFASKFSENGELLSNNFYNRLNYYQIVGNFALDIELFEENILSNYNTKFNLADSGLILLSGDGAHATAYRIHSDSDGHWFTFFDPNFGEFTSNKVSTATDAKQELYDFINFLSCNEENGYYPNGVGFELITTLNNVDYYINDIKNSWKFDKANIENTGTGEDSLPFEDFFANLDWHLIISSETYYVNKM